ncbi:MAG: hypothetical protein FXF54_02150 [Kosmotoga sp.]|nr:MAG: hypothetical protein FXF54_02150 [Kosmotoga sp.]
MKQLLIGLVVVLCIMLFATDPYLTEENVNEFITELEDQGFIVQQGMLYSFDMPDLFSNYITPSCYGNNADTPYCVYFLPPAPNQTVENSFPFTARMGKDEAIIFIGWTPPEVTYFSYETLIMFRHFPGEDVPTRIFAGVGDTVNIMNIKTGESIKEETEGTVFNAPTIIISTPDKNIDKMMRAAAKKVGFSQEIINTDVIPSPILKLGIDKYCDELIFGSRFAFFKNPEDKSYALDPSALKDGKFWTKPPYSHNHRGWVLRVTPSNPVELDPFPVPNLVPRDSGDYSELNLKPTMDKLEEAIIEYYSDFDAVSLRTRRWIELSYIAIQNNTDVLGDSRDSIYFRTESFLLGKDTEDFAIVFGPIHALTGKAIYSSFVIYTDDLVQDLLPYESNILYGFLSVNSEQTPESKLGLIGSAERFLPDNPNAKYFYVWKIARSNPDNEDYCVTIPSETPCERITYNNLMVAFRAYINPATGVGPSYEEILMDKVIHFKPNK